MTCTVWPRRIKPVSTSLTHSLSFAWIDLPRNPHRHLILDLTVFNVTSFSMRQRRTALGFPKVRRQPSTCSCYEMEVFSLTQALLRTVLSATLLNTLNVHCLLVSYLCHGAWVALGYLWIICGPLQGQSLLHLFSSGPIPMWLDKSNIGVETISFWWEYTWTDLCSNAVTHSLIFSGNVGNPWGEVIKIFRIGKAL